MRVCDFCVHWREDDSCRLGLKLPKAMNCPSFEPSLERFCSDPKDFVGAPQIVQMAAYFGMKGRELKKVNLMATREESARTKLSFNA